MLDLVGGRQQNFFHLRDGATLIRDPEGQYLDNLAAAKAEAILDLVTASYRRFTAQPLRTDK
jgi:hypothetical protein